MSVLPFEKSPIESMVRINLICFKKTLPPPIGMAPAEWSRRIDSDHIIESDNKYRPQMAGA